jgi:hypothetical protein
MCLDPEGQGCQIVLSSLDLVEETRAMARRTALQAEFQARRVRVPDEYYKHSGFENWLENGILPTKDLLEEVQKPKRVTLDEVLESRLLMNVHAKICHTQVLSKMARKLKAKTCPEQPTLGVRSMVLRLKIRPSSGN